MESSDREVVRVARDWLVEDHPATLVTVARTWGSSPRPVGSLMAIRGDGRLVGSVSGGCVEEDLVQRLREDSCSGPRLVCYGGARNDAARLGLPCGGRLELLLEPINNPLHMTRLLRSIDRRKLLCRSVEIVSGQTRLAKAEGDAQFHYDGQTLTKVFGPAWRLLLIGAGQLSRCVAQFALGLDYQVIVCEPRENHAESWHLADTTLDTRMPDDVVQGLQMDSRSAVITLTHDPRLDDLALLEALPSQAFFVGALGSIPTNQRRRERLASLNLEPQALARLRGPVGLPIGSHTPPEIAISILAELTAVRNGVAPATATAPRVGHLA